MTMNVVDVPGYETLSYMDGKESDHCLARNFQNNIVKEEVPVIALNDLIPETITNIDFVSIDVEGFEIEVLEGLDLMKYAPRLFVIEGCDKKVNSYLENYGYTPVARTWTNYFYTKIISEAEYFNIWQYFESDEYELYR